ncbi:hypothetical protein C8J25_11221 [Sphingomonas faeni]|uniref:Uncharacterized protein n=1 Tax=Sphingomonas faeni TaxID=185950 RepID=A0A2T5TXU3_9SPHN|nr:hypothetical protein C8J25_11221 [Sphingomonas faeni]
MTRRALSRPRRSGAEWGVRTALALGAAALAYGSITHTLAYSLRASATQLAHALAPSDGRITALLAEQMSGPEASATDRRQANILASEALREEPTAVPAVSTLGINAQIHGDTAAARRIFAQSDALSRRDVRTRLWAIEDAVGRQDIPETLRNYDIALRTSRAMPDLLFPVLAGAIGDPNIRAGLVKILSSRPLWLPQWIVYISGNGPNARDAVALFRALDQARVPIPYDARSALLRRLVGQGLVEEAWAFYAASTRNADRRMSRDPQFQADHAVPSPFDWTAIQDNSIASSIQRGQRGGIFDFTASAGMGGPMLLQMQMLPPGRYVIEGTSTGIDPSEPSRPYWRLACTSGRELGRVGIPADPAAQGQFRGNFDVPMGCATQYLTLVARASSQTSGVSGQITRAFLHPVKL